MKPHRKKLSALKKLVSFLGVRAAVQRGIWAGLLLGWAASASAVDFGKRSVVADYWHEDLRILNTTAGPLSLAPGMVVSGSEAGDFAARALTSGSVPLGGELMVRVTFNPSATGLRNAQIAVPTDNPAIGTVSFPLQGEGGDFVETVLNSPGIQTLAGTVPGTVRLLQGTLMLTADLTIAGDLILAGGAVDLNGHSLTTARNIRFTGPVGLTAGGDSPVAAGGHILMDNGTLVVAGSGVQVLGDLRIQALSETVEGSLTFSASSGLLTMTNPAGRLKVEGDFFTDSVLNHTNNLTQGILELRGSFTQLNTQANTPGYYNFHTSDNHRVLLTGPAERNLSFVSPGGPSAFQTLEISTSAPTHHLPSLNTQTLTLNGNPLTAGLVVAHHDWMLTENTVVAGDMTLSGVVLNLNGYTLQVQGRVIHTNGQLLVGTGRLETTGDYRIQTPAGLDYSASSGLLTMTNPAGRVFVGGNFFTDSVLNHTNNLTQGILELRGSFTQLNTQSNTPGYYNFHTSENHRVLLTGPVERNLSFISPGGASAFQTLEIATTAPVHHLPSLNTQTLTLNGNPVTADLVVAHHDWVLTENTVVAGDMTLSGVVLNLNGYTLQVQGRLIHSAGQLLVGAGRLETTGDYRIQTPAGPDYSASGGLLTMTNPSDRIVVGGNFTTDSVLDHTGNLNSGTLELRGSFTQLNTQGNPPGSNNFHASGNHRVLLTGSAERGLSFVSPGGASAFQTLEIATTAPVHHLPSLNTQTLRLNGNPLTAGLVVAHHDWVLTENTVVAGDMTLSGVLLNLNGYTLQVQGRVIHTNGQLMVGSGGMETTGDYRIQTPAGLDYSASSGLLTMTNPADRVIVGGNFFTDSVLNHTNNLTQGTLELRGSFTQLNTQGNPPGSYNFHASDNHRVLLTGSAERSLSFVSPGAASAFQALEILTSAPTHHLPSLNTQTLRLNGNPLTAGLVVAHHDWVLTENTVVAGDMTLSGVLLNLNGYTLQVQGRVIHTKGQLMVGSGGLETTGDYRIQTPAGLDYSASSGLLTMTNPADRVIVGGNFFTDSVLNHTNNLTQGTLELRGSFTQLNTQGNPPGSYNFHASDNHRVLLTGSAERTLSFVSPGGPSNFQTLELGSVAAVHHLPSLNTQVLVTNGHPLTGGLNVGSLAFTLPEDITVAGEMTLLGAVLNLNGHSLTVQGRLIHSAGQMLIGGGHLNITGDYRIQTPAGADYSASGGLLTMTNPADQVVVGGNFVTGSALNHTGNLTSGTLELHGNFTQLNATGNPPAAYSFITTGTHRVVLSGGSDQHLSFASPDASHFTTLEVLNNPAATVLFDTRSVITTLFDHHLRNFVIAPSAPATDFPDSDGDGIRDHLEAFPVGDADNNGVPDDATPQNYTYEKWATLFFWQGDPNLALTSAPHADPDHDGVPNALEYVMGSFPMRSEVPRQVFTITQIGTQKHLTLTYPHVKVSDGSVTSSVVASATLAAGSWLPVGAQPTILSDDGQVEMIRIIDPVTVGTGAKRFIAIMGQSVSAP